MAKIKTASDLKYAVEQSGKSPHFFTRETMRFWGDTMQNYGVRQPREIATTTGEKRIAFELFRRRPVKHGVADSSYFDATTFERIHARKTVTLADMQVALHALIDASRTSPTYSKLKNE